MIALRTTGPTTLYNEDIEARAKDAESRKALFTIAANDLVIRVDDGWLKATWMPTSAFPRRFSPDKWRKVLNALHTVATALDGADGSRSSTRSA